MLFLGRARAASKCFQRAVYASTLPIFRPYKFAKDHISSTEIITRVHTKIWYSAGVHAIMRHVIVFAIHECITAMPATKGDRGRVLRCSKGKASARPCHGESLAGRQERKITHHPDARAECVWGQVRPELAFYNTRVAVRTGDTAVQHF